jgi:hypothetical protein
MFCANFPDFDDENFTIEIYKPSLHVQNAQILINFTAIIVGHETRKFMVC